MSKDNTVLAVVIKEKTRVENSIEREGAIKKNLEILEAAVAHIAEQVEANKPLPEDSNFASYEDWEVACNKEMKAIQANLETIEKQKCLLTAYEFYITETQKAQA